MNYSLPYLVSHLPHGTKNHPAEEKNAMKGALKETLEEPMMKEEVEDTPKKDPIKPYTNSCYSCGEK